MKGFLVKPREAKNIKYKTTVRDLLFIICGCAISAAALDLFLIPLHIAPGGLAALGGIAQHYLPITAGIAVAVMNIPLFLASLKMKKVFFYKSLVGAAAFSLFLDLFSRFQVITDDLMMAAIFGGLMMGVGFGIVFLGGGSSGGTDIAGWLILRKFPNIKLGRAILIFDLVIIAVQSFIYGNITLGFYAAVGMYINSKVIDSILEGGTSAKTAYVISGQCEEIAGRITKEMGRGVTGLLAKGMYTGTDRLVLLCTVSGRELPRLKKIVKEADPNAFIIMNDVKEVLGEGFGSINNI